MASRKLTRLRRIHDRERAENSLGSLRAGTGNFYENYRALYGLWCSNNASVPELRPLFRMEGIDPGGTLSITDKFIADVRAIAKEIPPLVPDPKVSQ